MNIARLEPTRQFVDRIVLLNRFHTPDEDDYEGARKVLAKVHGGFPDASIHEQAAYLLANLASAGAFEEANFRTAWDYVCDTLTHRGFDLRATTAEAQNLASELQEGESNDESLEADLAEWFRPRIHRGVA